MNIVSNHIFRPSSISPLSLSPHKLSAILPACPQIHVET